jgi:hypothetical protein
MKSVVVCLILAATFAFSQSAFHADPKARILDSYGKLPLSFEVNHGQTDSSVKFLSRTGAYSLFLTRDEAVFTLNGKTEKSGGTHPSGVLRMKLRNANAAAKVSGVDELAGTSNYFIGNDPTKWRRNVPTYAKVKYEGIYSGIDLVYYGNQRQLEYDFIVGPGADPRRIAFDITGAKRIQRDAHGDLVFKMGDDEIRWYRPVVYQEKDEERQLVAAHYVITDTNRVGFEVAGYDTSKPLYIDPLIYSTYLGGSGADYGQGIAVDSAGNAYVTGYTYSTDFPTVNPLQAANGGGGNNDAFVCKINPAGSALVYSTYLGGSGFDGGNGIAVDSAGDAYVTGWTGSSDFPTKNPLQRKFGGSYFDAFVAKLDPEGSALVYSTYLGGSGDDEGLGIAVDSADSAYITGFTESTNFPTMNPLQPTNHGGLNDEDIFVAKINPEGSALVYSTYLGGSGDDCSFGIAVDSAGSAYVTGDTLSTDFPTMNPLQAANKGYENVFVSKLNSAGSALVYSTYLGGSDIDIGFGIALDKIGNSYVVGWATSADFPTTPGVFQTVCNGGSNCDGLGDGFVAKLNSTGSALGYSTFLGGNKTDTVYGVAVDSTGNAYVTGQTESTDFPTTKNPLQRANRGGNGDSFVAKLNSSGSGLFYSTYLGGSGGDGGLSIVVDGSEGAYVIGQTGSTNFPTMNPLQAANGGGNDAFVAKLSIATETTKTALSSSPNPSTFGQPVIFTAVVTSGVGTPPDGETISFMKGKAVLGIGTLSGGSASFTTSALTVPSDGITAVYGGDPNFGGSTSKAVKQEVDKATTTTALASSLNPSNAGQSVTFTASVTPQFGGTVTGTVSFYDGTTLLKTASLSGGVAKYTTAKLAVGTHNITATYKGSTSFDGSSASLTQTVN